MKALTTSFIGLLLSQCLTLAQMTYWVDADCRNGEREQRLNDAIEGAIEMAQRGQERLADGEDTRHISNFKTLFQVEPTDQNARNTVDGDYNLLHFVEYRCHLLRYI